MTRGDATLRRRGHRCGRDLSAVFFDEYAFKDSRLSALNIDLYIRDAQASGLGSKGDFLADTASACLIWAETEKSLA